MNSHPISPDLQLAFDVGHSSIGWAVLQKSDGQTPGINILGCGSVVFRANDCLVSSRRAYRRQRRHIRSTRQRIARMKTLLQQRGVLTAAELEKPGCAWPWKLSARVLQGGKLLTWRELWDVLRWYAHNRGYDGNRRWSAADEAAQSEDSEKEGMQSCFPPFCKSSSASVWIPHLASHTSSANAALRWLTTSWNPSAPVWTGASCSGLNNTQTQKIGK